MSWVRNVKDRTAAWSRRQEKAKVDYYLLDHAEVILVADAEIIQLPSGMAVALTRRTTPRGQP